MENINRFRFDDKPSCKLLHSESKVQHNNNKLEISALHCPGAIIWLSGDWDGDGVVTVPQYRVFTVHSTGQITGCS